MSILDKVQIGQIVKVNLEKSQDRLDQETIDAVNISSIAKINEFKITDGRGIGVILKLSNGKEQWFFENEIDLLDENGLVMPKDIITGRNNLISEILEKIKYENTQKVSKLLNPLNFFLWLMVAFKDNI